MRIYWSYESIPELAGLPEAEQRRALRRCLPSRSWKQWLAAVAIACAEGLIIFLILMPPVADMLSPLPAFLVLAVVNVIGAMIYSQVMIHRLGPLLRRERPGSWCTCGYDLTGNTSSTCPECGAACKAADPAGVSPAAGN